MIGVDDEESQKEHENGFSEEPTVNRFCRKTFPLNRDKINCFNISKQDFVCQGNVWTVFCVQLCVSGHFVVCNSIPASHRVNQSLLKKISIKNN